MRTQEKEFNSTQRIKENEAHIKINQAVEEKDKEINKVSQENAVLKKEVEILEKAFENMGFDVKDMKEILKGHGKVQW